MREGEEKGREKEREGVRMRDNNLFFGFFKKMIYIDIILGF